MRSKESPSGSTAVRGNCTTWQEPYNLTQGRDTQMEEQGLMGPCSADMLIPGLEEAPVSKYLMQQSSGVLLVPSINE